MKKPSKSEVTKNIITSIIITAIAISFMTYVVAYMFKVISIINHSE